MYNQRKTLKFKSLTVLYIKIFTVFLNIFCTIGKFELSISNLAANINIKYIFYCILFYIVDNRSTIYNCIRLLYTYTWI